VAWDCSFPPVRVFFRLGLIALLIAVFPANLECGRFTAGRASAYPRGACGASAFSVCLHLVGPPDLSF